MWFVYFYAISTVVVFVVVKIEAMAIMSKIRYNNIKLNMPKSNFWIRLSKELPYFIPFVNIFLALVMIFSSDKMYEKIVEKYKEVE